MTVLTAFFTHSTLMQLSNLDQKGNDQFSLNVLHSSCLTLKELYATFRAYL